MPRMLFLSLPVADLPRAVAFYRALGFIPNPHFSDDTTAALSWSQAIHLMLLTHARWHSFTARPMAPDGSARVMMSLAADDRAMVDRLNQAAAAHGGQGDVNPVQDHGFMYARDFADPDGHLWGAVWMDPAAIPPADPAVPA